MACNCTCNDTNNQCSREDLLSEVRNYDFAITDLSLYLDTHPDDKEAVELHNKYCKCYKTAVDNYQRKYGPLSILCPCNSWRWLEQPWPWEGGNV